MTWYISDFGRFRTEREGLEQFGIRADWFVPLRWRFDDSMRLVLEADIAVGGKNWPIYLQYPELFPHTPPSVFPRGDKTRWSSHQYGKGGELCLEYGPDNWTPDLTGVHLIESTHRLLEGENPAPGQRGTVASRHSEMLGQRFRSEYSRFLLTPSSQAALSSIPLKTPFSGTLVSVHHKEVVVHVVKTLAQPDGATWNDAEIPAQLADEYFVSPVSICRIDPDAELPPTAGLAEFRADCAAFGLSADKLYAIILSGAEAHLFFLWEKDNSVAAIAAIPTQPAQRRLDDAHAALKSKKIGLVGCGSIGSKLAAMMARSGVEKWLLADDDLLLPENFVRHELDWRDAGTHKAQSLARRLELVNPAVDATVWRVRLGGQSSAASAETILKLLGECDLIIDATANPDILNLIAAVAAAKSKPVIWAEVFGGIGGLIARFRPGVEPPPQYMRRAIENWFGEQNAQPVRATRSYETGGDGASLIADDADVSVITAHAARFAIDLLVRDSSIFPHSVYAIGMGVGSVFTEPFDTRPIDVGPPPVEAAKSALSEEEIAAQVTAILELFKACSDEAAAASKNNQAPQA